MRQARDAGLSARLERLIRPAVRAAQAYPVRPAGNSIKLDAMENPYPLPAEMAQSLAGSLSATALNRYPDPAAADLKAVLRQALAIPESHALLLGNGSDELIQLIAMAVAGPDVTLLAPEPSFVMYRLVATATGCRYCGVDLAPGDFALDTVAMLTAIEREQPAVVFLAWPNNPTGNLFAAADVRHVIEAAPGLVVIDEAYHAFAGESFVPILTEYDHVLVLRTLSKLGLAGLRIGAMIGNPAWIEQFDKLRLPYNLGCLNQVAAREILLQPQVLSGQVEAIQGERQRLLAALQAQPGIRVWPSAANFLLFRVASNQAERIYEGLLERGVLIKLLHGQHPLLKDCLRTTVGLPEENDRFLEALQDCMRG